MTTVNVDGNDYTEIYGLGAADDDGVAEADIYCAGALHGASWRDASDDSKAMSLVTVKRLLDRQRWAEAYNTFALRTVEENIVNASFELAISLLDGSDVQNEANTVNKLTSLQAGSVALSFYHGADGANPQRFPQIVTELLAGYLDGGVSGMLTGVATGVDTEDESVTNTDLTFNRGM